jgi:hypothetical protein
MVLAHPTGHAPLRDRYLKPQRLSACLPACLPTRPTTSPSCGNGYAASASASASPARASSPANGCAGLPLPKTSFAEVGAGARDARVLEHGRTNTWANFLRSRAALPACDFRETITLSGARLHVCAVIEHVGRRTRVLGTTAHPTASWVTHIAKNLVMASRTTAAGPGS